MAVGQGFSKVVTSGSVFHYDTGDIINSFKGKPTTNQLLTIGYTYGTQNQTYFKSSYGTEYDIIPGMGGPVLVNYCNFFNDYNGGSGACCPSVFYFGNFSVTPNTTYTYQIVYKTPDGYANGNYMYHYEFGPGGYVTEYGLWDSNRTQDLGNGWVHAWGTFTSNANTNYFQTYLFHYQYTQTKIQVARISLTQGDTTIPPRQLLAPTVSRSNTEGLLDLTGNYTIDLSNISFDSTGNIAFDGTNDFIDTNFPAMTINNPTIEAVVYRDTNTGRYESIIQINAASDDALYVYPGGYLGFWPCAASSLTVPVGQWNYVAVSYDGSNLTYCVNGTTQVIASSCADITDWDFLRMGAIGAGDGERWIGKIAVAKVYNRALSIGELTQNYNHYKTRFNLT
jgi:hypothetical protein